MKNYEESECTYVLFGKEAVDLYNVSLKLLISSTVHVDYKLGVYNNVKQFMIDQKKWGASIEIEESEYERLKKHAFRRPDDTDDVGSMTKRKRFFSFLNL